jgi:anti-sigma28 factor (negative regulator of flagellin synthesis)
MQIRTVSDSVQLAEQTRPLGGARTKAEAPEKVASADTAAEGDTRAVSGEALEKAKIAQYVKIVKEMPAIREDKVAEAKRKLASGEYRRPEVAEKIAERLLEQ